MNCKAACGLEDHFWVVNLVRSLQDFVECAVIMACLFEVILYFIFIMEENDYVLGLKFIVNVGVGREQ